MSPAPPEVGGSDWRRNTRRRLIAARTAVDERVRAGASQLIERALEAAFPPGSHAIVAGYWPIRGEFDPLPYLARCIAAGASAALPVVALANAPLGFRAWTPDTGMSDGRWGARHPAGGPELTPDLVLVPLVGFDAAGHRLGYGGGYFDRTLAQLAPRPTAVGLGFELGRLESVQPGAHDQRLDAIITEGGLFRSLNQQSD
jgi:5-formyltetrahydrofolate cyclo-ligase